MSAFIQSLMDQKGVYIRLLEGFREYEGNEELISKLLRSLYGLK